MEVQYKLLILLSVSCLCSSGHLQRLGGFLADAHQQIHSKVHDVAGAVIGGFASIAGGHADHHGGRPTGPTSPNNGGETVVVIVEEISQGNGAPPQTPYGPPHHPHRPPPNDGFNHHHHHHPYKHPSHNQPGYGQRPQQQNNYGNRHPGQNQFPGNPYNQGNNGNNYFNGDGNPNQNGNPNDPSHNGHEFTSPEQNKPNLDGNYTPTETYNGQQHNNAHKAENTEKEINDKTTKKPTSDGPLLVPLNDYTYGGDKITVNTPKRDTADTSSQGAEANDEDFPIDIRFKDE